MRITGKWIGSLTFRIAEGSVTLGEALWFIAWRFGVRKNPLVIEGTSFEDIDRTTWGLIATILVSREYNPSGFEIGSDHSVVDIGAHRGIFLSHAAKRTRASILAIEPDPENYRFLQKLVQTNGYLNVQLLNAAVADTGGEARLYQASVSSRHTLLGLDQKSGESLEDSLVVPTVSLDESLASIPIVDFLKIDAEGAESLILNSASNETLSRIQKLVVELHGLHEAGANESIEKRLAEFFVDISVRQTSPSLGLLYARKL